MNANFARAVEVLVQKFKEFPMSDKVVEPADAARMLKHAIGAAAMHDTDEFDEMLLQDAGIALARCRWKFDRPVRVVWFVRGYREDNPSRPCYVLRNGAWCFISVDLGVEDSFSCREHAQVVRKNYARNFVPSPCTQETLVFRVVCRKYYTTRRKILKNGV